MRSVLALLGCAISMAAAAHDFSAGDVRIGHPYALPTPAGIKNGAAYLATLENRSPQPDKLLRVSTPLARHVEFHTTLIDEAGVMRMRELSSVPLAPGASLKMRPGQGVHLMLRDIQQPLKEGDTFPMTLEFERGGRAEVKVYVQTPRQRKVDSDHRH
jgi:copper(I)-binding protein